MTHIYFIFHFVVSASLNLSFMVGGTSYSYLESTEFEKIAVAKVLIHRWAQWVNSIPGGCYLRKP